MGSKIVELLSRSIPSIPFYFIADYSRGTVYMQERRYILTEEPGSPLPAPGHTHTAQHAV